MAGTVHQLYKPIDTDFFSLKLPSLQFMIVSLEITAYMTHATPINNAFVTHIPIPIRSQYQ